MPFRCKFAAIFCAIGISLITTAQAQSLAWAVYTDGEGAIWVANQATPPNPQVWKRMDNHSFLSEAQAKGNACMLVTKGDLFNRKYTSVQISRADWSCP